MKAPLLTANRGIPLLIFLAFLLLGAAIVDHYGVYWDENSQRGNGYRALEYITGNEGLSYDDRPTDFDIHYGPAFELSLVLVELLLDLSDRRSIYLSRHILVHLFFLIGGLFCYLLVYRLFNNRLLAAFAMLLFLLHPRLYAHSFFNSKDISFLSMFMIALYLVHRAFSKGSLGGFALCGAGVAALTSLRAMGVILFVLVPALRLLDCLWASNWQERRRLVWTTGAFLLFGLLALYALFPQFWGNPLGYLEGIGGLASHPTAQVVTSLFRGELVTGDELPPLYFPVWFLISTPPIALALGALGVASVLAQGVIRPGKALGNTRLRFGRLLVACFVLPVAAIVALGAQSYDSWRHLYFIHAPFCLLAAFGLHGLAHRLKRLALWACSLTALGLGTTALAMVQLHPNQQLYFNFLVDRATAEHLRANYDLEYWGVASRQALEHLLQRHPSRDIRVADRYGHVARNRLILPEADRRRIVPITYPNYDLPDFYVTNYREQILYQRTVRDNFRPSVYDLRAYNNTLLTAKVVNLALADEKTANAQQRKFQLAKAGKLMAESNFSVHLDGNQLSYVKESCVAEDMRMRFFLHVIPQDVLDLPIKHRPRRRDNLDFDFPQYGVFLDGQCLASVALPNYPILKINTGQFTKAGNVWGEEFDI